MALQNVMGRYVYINTVFVDKTKPNTYAAEVRRVENKPYMRVAFQPQNVFTY